jgi:large repetitive protein
MTCTETWSNDGSSNLVIISKQAASCSLADLAGTWEGNSLSVGSTNARARMSETINSNGTFTGTNTKSDGTTNSISGTVSISSDGVVTCVSGSCADPTYLSFMNSGKTIMVGTSGAATTAEDAGIFVYTKQAASYSMADFVGTWQGNGLAAGPAAPWWENDTFTIGPDGTFSFLSTGSDGTSNSGSGTVSVSSGGVITVGSNSTARGVLDANKTVMVFTNTLLDGVTQELKIFTKNGVVPSDETAGIDPSVSNNVLGSSSATAGDSFEPTNGSTTPTSNDSHSTASSTSPSNPGSISAQAGGSPTTESSPPNGTGNTPAMTTNPAGVGPASMVSNNAAPTTAPVAPTIVAATTSYVQQTAGNARATVNFKLPTNGGGQIKNCTVTSNPGGITATGSGSPIVVSSLTNGTAYTFTVTASNKIGTSPPSNASNSVTPLAVPGAPSIVAAETDNGEAKVSFKAPASNGGSLITLYTVTSNSGHKASGTASPISVKGLTKGTFYTFTVTATNKVGAGPPSSASNRVLSR